MRSVPKEKDIHVASWSDKELSLSLHCSESQSYTLNAVCWESRLSAAGSQCRREVPSLCPRGASCHRPHSDSA